MLLNQPDDPRQLCVLASWTFSATWRLQTASKSAAAVGLGCCRCLECKTSQGYADTDCECRVQLRPSKTTAMFYRVRMVTGLLYRRAHDANVLGSTTSYDQNIRPTQVLALWTRIEEQMTYSNLSEWFEYASGVARKRTLDAKLRKIRIGQTLTDALTDASKLP